MACVAINSSPTFSFAKSRLLQLVLHRAYLNQRFPQITESISPLLELAERQVRLERMAKDYFAHFDSLDGIPKK
jgi:hypothetical protein